MTEYQFATFDTAIGRCGIVWGERGIHAVQLPMGTEEKTRGRLRQRHGDIAEATPAVGGAACDRRDRRIARGQAERSHQGRARSRGHAGIQSRRLRHRAHHPAGQDHDLWRLAKRLGGVELSRDVGQALGRNPCPIVVPCHRVLAAGGKPGGFSANGGVVTKLRMLAIEGAVVNHTPNLFD